MNGTGAITVTTGLFDPGDPGTLTLVVRVNPGAPIGTIITNTVTVDERHHADPSSANNTAAETTTVANSANLSVTLNGAPSTVLAGANLTYTVDLANAGPQTANDATVTVPVPASTTFVSLTAPAGWTPTTPAVGAGGTVTVTKSSFAAGEGPPTFTLVVKVDPATPHGTAIGANATVSTSSTDGNSADDSATSAPSTVDASTNLTVTMGGAPSPVTNGSDLTYTISLSNAGPLAAQNVVVASAIPFRTTFVSATVSQMAPPGWVVTAPAVGGTGAVTFQRTTFASTDVAHVPARRQSRCGDAAEHHHLASGERDEHDARFAASEQLRVRHDAGAAALYARFRSRMPTSRKVRAARRRPCSRSA